VEEVLKLKSQPGKDILVSGMSLASSLMDQGLVDEYWLVIHPIFLGTGKPLTKELHQRVDLKLLDVKPFKSGAVALHYRASD